jgi:hypothetical protein
VRSRTRARATEAEGARERFLAAIEHTPARCTGREAEDPFPKEWIIVDGQKLAKNAWDSFPEYARSMAGIVGGTRRPYKPTPPGQPIPFPAPHCGWWWCTADEQGQSPPWAELQKALDVLLRHGIDPWGRDFAEVAYQYFAVEDAAREKKPYLIVQEGLNNILGTLDQELGRFGGVCDAGRLVRTWLLELEPLLAEARKAEPDVKTGRAKDIPQRQSIVVAAHHEMKAADTAAILYLAGIVRSVSFENVRRSVEQRARSMRVPTKPSR